MTITRREILKAGAAAAALGASTRVPAQPLIMTPASELITRSGKRRVVIAGGGWGGMTAARHLREQAPDLEVILLERNPVFWSCPLSNKWLIDVVDTNFLVKSYMAPAKRHGYTFVQTEISEIDRAKKRVHTAQGYLDYDWLVVSAGIRYGFEAWFGNDKKAIDYTRINYPTAYIPSAEHALVKQKIHNFKGGCHRRRIVARPRRMSAPA